MTDPPDGPEPGPPLSKPARGEAVWIVALGLVLAAGLSWWAYAPSRTGPAPAEKGGARPMEGYVGARACRDCHPGEYAAFTASGHARTLAPAAETGVADWLDGRQVEDPERPGSAWNSHLQDGRLVAQGEGGQAGRLLLDYAFGSGRHAMTFISVLDPTPGRVTAREYRLTYFDHLDAMGVTPGQRGKIGQPGFTPAGRELDVELTYKCFNCHTTRPSARSATELDLATLIPNVSCERCHGPARAHVEAARRGEGDLSMPLGLDGWTASDLVRACGECHRLPEMAPASAIHAENPMLVRFQPIGLIQSPCYRRSGGRLSCVTCHEPHSRTSTDRAGYVAICLDCHRAEPQATCPVSPLGGCLDCHMPRRDAGNGLLFTDHWIRVRPAVEPGGP